MSASATNQLPNVGAAPRKGLKFTLWFVQGLLALVFLGASTTKLIGRPDMIALFAAIGIGQWFRYVTGILELTGAVLILVPKTRRSGAGLLLAIMIGAIVVNFSLDVSVIPPLVLLVLASFVAWGGGQRTRPSFSKN